MYQTCVPIHLDTKKLFFGKLPIHLAGILIGMKQTYLLLMSITFLSSCAALPDSVAERSAVSVLSVPQGFQFAQSENSHIIAGLMELFDDQVLSTLVGRSLDHNLDIQLAAKQLEEAGFNADAELGKLLPKVTGNIATNRAQGAEGKPGGTYSPSLDVSWEVDIWGKVRDQRGVSDVTALAQVENYRAARDSIAAQVMQGWFDVVTTKRLLDLEKSRLSNLRKSAENSRRNYRSGLGELNDLAAVERDIAQTQVTVTSSIDNHNTAVRSLQVLTGQYPSGYLTSDYKMPALLSPPTAGVPAALLTQRPDLRRAWQDVIAADKSVQVAHKEMFPSLNLTGSFGTQSSDFSELLSAPTIWSLASQLSVPLFNAGQLKNNMNAAQSRAEQAWVRYLQTALLAFQEVEQALDRETLFADQEKQQANAVNYAEKTADIFEDRYRNGFVSILEYLNAQNTVFDSKAQLLDIRNQRLKNRVALALALGKGV